MYQLPETCVVLDMKKEQRSNPFGLELFYLLVISLYLRA